MPNPLNGELAAFLQPSDCVNSDQPAITSLAASLVDPDDAHLDNAIRLYYWVRDQIRYNPYTAWDNREDLKATATLKIGEGWCVPKAILLAALCRATGIPARLGFADVRNHLSTARLRELLQTDIFYYHGYCAIYLHGKWVKSTPAFNLSLCERFHLRPLEFDGINDSIYHPFDESGNQHMEYLAYHGEFADVPFEDMMVCFRQEYPAMFGPDAGSGFNVGAKPDMDDWEADVALETG